MQVFEVVALIQRLIVDTLQLDIPRAAIGPDEPLASLEATFEGVDYSFDSVDLVEILSAVEDALGADLLEDDALRAVFAEGTLRDFAAYLVDRFPEGRLQQLCASDH